MIDRRIDLIVKKDNINSVMSVLTLVLQLGITMLVSVVFCTLGAAWLGERTGLGFLAVVGFFVGAAAGMSACWKLISRMTASWPKSPLAEESLREAAKGGSADELVNESLKEDE